MHSLEKKNLYCETNIICAYLAINTFYKWNLFESWGCQRLICSKFLMPPNQLHMDWWNVDLNVIWKFSFFFFICICLFYEIMLSEKQVCWYCDILILNIILVPIYALIKPINIQIWRDFEIWWKSKPPPSICISLNAS